MLRWVVIGLLIANVAVFLTIGNQSDLSDQVSAVEPVGVNVQAMRLLNEIEKQLPASLPQAKTDEDAAASNADETAVVASGLSAVQRTEEQDDLAAVPDIDNEDVQEPDGAHADQQLAPYCVRVGPFSDEQALQQASTWMMENNVDSRPVTGNSREVKAIRVFAGPFSEQESLRRYVAELEIKQLQFKAMNRDLEYYVYGNSASGFRISFGYFHQQELANQYMKDLQLIGIQAELDVDYETIGPLHWLESTLPVDVAERLKSRQWKDDKTAVTEIEC